MRAWFLALYTLVGCESSRVELHVHLDGAVSPATLLEVVIKRNHTLPSGLAADEASLAAALREGDPWSLILNIIGGDEWAIELAAERFVHFQEEHRVEYTEVRYAPQTLAVSRWFGQRLSPSATVAAVTRGLRKGIAALPSGTSLTVYQILVAMRSLSPEACDEVRGLVESLRPLPPSHHARVGDVVGLDLAGDERSVLNTPFVGCFARAAAAGVPITIHAGEVSNVSEVSSAVLQMGARRIGHGYIAASSEATMALLAARHVHVEYCPVPELLERLAGYHPDGVARAFLSHGVSFGLSTDSPSVLQSTAERDEELARLSGLSAAAIADRYVEACCAAFGPCREQLQPTCGVLA